MAASVPLEELHGALVALRGRERLEGAEIPPLARARILLARVEAELARLELPDHAAKLLIAAVARHLASPRRMRLRGQECRRVPATDALSYSVRRTSSTLTWSNPRRRQIGGLSQRLDRCADFAAAVGTLPLHA